MPPFTIHQPPIASAVHQRIQTLSDGDAPPPHYIDTSAAHGHRRCAYSPAAAPHVGAFAVPGFQHVPTSKYTGSDTDVDDVNSPPEHTTPAAVAIATMSVLPALVMNPSCTHPPRAAHAVVHDSPTPPSTQYAPWRYEGGGGVDTGELDTDELTVDAGVPDTDEVPVSPTVGALLRVPPADPVRVAVKVNELVRLPVTLAVVLRVAAGDAVLLRLDVTVAVFDFVTAALRVAVFDPVGEAVTLRVICAVCVDVFVPLAVRVEDLEVETVAVRDRVPVGLAV